MNEALIERWNSVVGPEDEVYVLGDLMLGMEDNIKYVKQLKGLIHVILGNHDTTPRIELYNNCHNIIEVVYSTQIKYNKQVFYLSHYPCLCANYDDDKPLKAKVINVCGHAHTFDSFADWDKGIIYHAEVEALNGYPIEIEDMLNQVRKRFYSDRVSAAAGSTDLRRCWKCVHDMRYCNETDYNGQCVKYKEIYLSAGPSISSKIYTSKNYILDLSRCHKCVHESHCRVREFNDINGTCSNYKKDPPDGGFYG